MLKGWKKKNNCEKENIKMVLLFEVVFFWRYREKFGIIICLKNFLVVEEVGMNLLGLKL